MAEHLNFACSSCEEVVGAWSDGNPYFIDVHGQKQYAYHPDHERLALCIGNDVPHICLACGAMFNVDSRSPMTACPTCTSPEIVDILELDGRPCPFCKAGVFVQNDDVRLIS